MNPQMNVARSLPLNNGTVIPALGLGTSLLSGRAETPVRLALEAGYRHIDTARMYRTEAEIGKAVKESGVPREDLFITTKMHQEDAGYATALAAIDESLRQLSMDYVDLYLIHWPHRDSAQVRKDTWRAFEEILHSGKARAIGVSNFDIELLEEMKGYASVPPAANQIEFHPFLYQKELMDYCHREGIVVVGYSPLTRKGRLDDARISHIAKKYGRSEAQILLRWSLEKGNAVIPKASSKEHLEENMAVFDFDIAEEDNAALDSLNEGKSVLR